jgi:hypothetical protein
VDYLSWNGRFGKKKRFKELGGKNQVAAKNVLLSNKLSEKRHGGKHRVFPICEKTLVLRQLCITNPHLER